LSDNPSILSSCVLHVHLFSLCLFYFSDTLPPVSYTLSLHDALPISGVGAFVKDGAISFMEDGTNDADTTVKIGAAEVTWEKSAVDRKSTRLNSSHVSISYAVFCLKKKISTAAGKNMQTHTQRHGTYQ